MRENKNPTWRVRCSLLLSILYLSASPYFKIFNRSVVWFIRSQSFWHSWLHIFSYFTLQRTVVFFPLVSYRGWSPLLGHSFVNVFILRQWRFLVFRGLVRFKDFFKEGEAKFFSLRKISIRTIRSSEFIQSFCYERVTHKVLLVSLCPGLLMSAHINLLAENGRRIRWKKCATKRCRSLVSLLRVCSVDQRR